MSGGLDDFFSGGSQSEKKTAPEGSMVVVDLSNLIFRAIYGSDDFKSAAQVNVEMIRHMTFNMFGRYRRIFDKEEYPEFVLAFDGGNLWRNQTFPLYKMNRKLVNPDETSDERDLRAAVGTAFGQIRQELMASSPFPIVCAPGAEADDVMAVLSQERDKLGLHTALVTGDKDMRQLLRLKNVKLWSPNQGVSGGFVKMTKTEAEDFLYNLIFKGDGGDGVPGIKSPDNTFYPTRLRQPPVYEKETSVWKNHIDLEASPADPFHLFDCSTFFDLPEEAVTDEQKQTAFLRRNYFRNRTMVDLFWIPPVIRQRILDAFEEDKASLAPRKMKLYRYLGENNLRQHLNNIQHFV